MNSLTNVQIYQPSLAIQLGFSSDNPGQVTPSNVTSSDFVDGKDQLTDKIRQTYLTQIRELLKMRVANSDLEQPACGILYEKAPDALKKIFNLEIYRAFYENFIAASTLYLELKEKQTPNEVGVLGNFFVKCANDDRGDKFVFKSISLVLTKEKIEELIECLKDYSEEAEKLLQIHGGQMGEIDEKGPMANEIRQGYFSQLRRVLLMASDTPSDCMSSCEIMYKNAPPSLKKALEMDVNEAKLHLFLGEKQKSNEIELLATFVTKERIFLKKLVLTKARIEKLIGELERFNLRSKKALLV